jgi:hypothetical protein
MNTFDIIFQQHFEHWTIEYMSSELRSCLCIDDTPKEWEQFQDTDPPKTPTIWKGPLKICHKTSCGARMVTTCNHFGNLPFAPTYQYAFHSKYCMFYFTSTASPFVGGYFYWLQDEWINEFQWILYDYFVHRIVNFNIEIVNAKLNKLIHKDLDQEAVIEEQTKEDGTIEYVTKYVMKSVKPINT